MSRTDTVRHRVSDAERAELDELRAWLGVRTLSQVIRQAVEALKEESGFNLRNVEPLDRETAARMMEEHLAEHLRLAKQDAGAGHALPAFIPGTVATEGDQ